ncbi:MAG: hypothetical protein K0S98_1724 [Propionibacteriaceae bacterium]|nr:hypothetical protein [Propionibacteriaceae bacterium]
MHGIDTSCGYLFQPRRLPDTTGAPVPDGMRLRQPVLLAAWLTKIIRQVFRANHDRLLAIGFQDIGDIRRERRMTALVLHHKPPVDPD